jgi:Helicase HerA, central domain
LNSNHPATQAFINYRQSGNELPPEHIVGPLLAAFHDIANAEDSPSPAPFEKVLQQLLPLLPRHAHSEGESYFQTSLKDIVDLPDAIDALMSCCYGRDFKSALPKLRRIFDENLCNASGAAYSYKRLFEGPITHPSDYKDDNIEWAYLKDTPFLNVLNTRIPFPLLDQKEKHWAIFAQTGHGKTQALQALILEHLKEPDPPAMIIIDSESNMQAGTGMLANIERLALFDDTLRERIVVVDARAPNPPALNMFDVPPLNEEAEAEAIELYSYIFASLDQKLTGLQSTAFSFVARLMIEHGNANLTTLLDFLSEDAKTPAQSSFADIIERCDPYTRRYFERQFFGDRYVRETRGSISNRLFAVLRERPLQRMFDAPSNKLDLYDAIQNRKIVLVAPGGLGRYGTPLFARTMIALAMRAAYQRGGLPENQRHPALLFIDEAHGLFDEQLDTLLIRARKYGLFLRFATQFFDQIPHNMRSSILSNSDVFLAGGLSYNDSKTLAADMRTTPDFLFDTEKNDRVATEFATFVKGITPRAIKLAVPLGALEQQPQSAADTLQHRMIATRDRLATPTSTPLPEQSPQPVKPEKPQPLPANTLPILPQHYPIELPQLSYTTTALLDTGADRSMIPVTSIDHNGQHVTFVLDGHSHTLPVTKTMSFRGVGGITAPCPGVMLTITVAMVTADEEFFLSTAETHSFLVGRTFLRNRFHVSSNPQHPDNYREDY